MRKTVPTVTSFRQARRSVNADEVILRYKGQFHRLLRHDNTPHRRAFKAISRDFSERVADRGGLVEEGAIVTGTVMGIGAIVLGNSDISEYDHRSGVTFTTLSSNAVVIDSKLEGSRLNTKKPIIVRNSELLACVLRSNTNIIGTREEPRRGLFNVFLPDPGEMQRLSTLTALPHGISDLEKVELLLFFVTSMIKHDVSYLTYTTNVMDTCERALNRGTGVCVQQALVLYPLLKSAGLKPELVSGYYLPSGLGHIWLEIKIEGEKYAVDHFGVRPLSKVYAEYYEGDRHNPKEYGMRN